jgi:chromosome segregation ATPase
MERRATSLEEERRAADAMLQQARAEAEAASAEMTKVTEARESLQTELGQVMMEKEVALKAALKEQHEREKLEMKLQMAEASMKRLDAALRKSGVKVDVDVEVSRGGGVA